MKKSIFVGAGVVLVTAIAYYFLAHKGYSPPIVSQTKGDTMGNSQNERPKVSGKKIELIIGQPSAPATIIEYGDFKCPSCNYFLHTTEQQLRQDYINSGKLKIIFRAYPYLGPDSGRALIGAYCANEQDKFAEYHDAIYNYMWDTYYAKGDIKREIEDILTEKLLSQKAAVEGIDQDKFTKCLNSAEQNRNIDNDLILAADDEIQGTPSFKVNGQKIVGPQPYSVFKTLVDIQLR